MPDQKPLAKIPVKKADGTTVFLTMDEFREYKKQSTTQSGGSAPKKLEPGKTQKIEMPLPMVANIKTEVANVAPVKDIFIDEAKASHVDDIPLAKPPVVESKPVEVVPPPASKLQWKSSDHASLLEEDLAEEKKTIPAPTTTSDNTSTLLRTIKAQFPFPVSKDIEGRFDSLVLSRIRDIRTPLDVEQYAKMSKDQGGLGMEEDQVSMLLAVIAAAQKISAPPTSSQSQPSVPKPPAPTAAVPTSPTPVRQAPPITPVMNPQTTPRIPLPIEPQEYTFNPAPKSSPAGSGKAMMQDIVPPERRRTMGPVDELQFFSLVDFRRLAPKTESAKEILKSKFQALQEESYVLFLDARDAWHQSPLFKVYQDTILGALENKWTLQNAIGNNPNGLTLEEVNAIVEVNHYLG